MEQELCINVKKLMLSDRGCLVEGKVIAGCLSVGEEVFVYASDETVKASCRGLVKYGQNTSKNLIVEKVCTGDEVTLLFSTTLYYQIRRALFILKHPDKLCSKFILSAELSADQMRDLKRILDDSHRQQIEFVALEKTITGKAVVCDGKIMAELLYPMWLQSGSEVVIRVEQTEIVRGSVLKI